MINSLLFDWLKKMRDLFPLFVFLNYLLTKKYFNAMKITKSELKQIIKEEAKRYVEIDNLRTRKARLQEAIDRLNEGEDVTAEELEEISWAGLKSAAGAIGGKVKDAAGKAGETIKKGAQDVKQAYQAGADKAKYEKAQAQLSDIATKINGLRKKMEADTAELQKQYAALTGGKPYKGGAIHKPVMSEGILEWVLEEGEE